MKEGPQKYDSEAEWMITVCCHCAGGLNETSSQYSWELNYPPSHSLAWWPVQDQGGKVGQAKETSVCLSAPWSFRPASPALLTAFLFPCYAMGYQHKICSVFSFFDQFPPPWSSMQAHVEVSVLSCSGLLLVLCGHHLPPVLLILTSSLQENQLWGGASAPSPGCQSGSWYCARLKSCGQEPDPPPAPQMVGCE